MSTSKVTRHLEDAVDLPVGVGVGVWRRPHHTGAALQGFYHEFVSAGIVQQTLLGKDTDLDIHGPLVRLNEGQDALQATQPDTRVDFEVGAHEGGAVQDAFFQGARGAGADVGGGELLLDCCHLFNGFVEVPFLGFAAIEQTGLIQVDMRLHKAGTDEPTLHIDLLALSLQGRFNGRDPAALDADIEQGLTRTRGQPGVPEYEIHGILL